MIITNHGKKSKGWKKHFDIFFPVAKVKFLINNMINTHEIITLNGVINYR